MPKYRTIIVGTRFHKGALDAFKRIGEGDVLYLIPDPQNEYDPFAVRVETFEGQMLGHIPRDLSQLTALMIAHEFAVPSARVVFDREVKKIEIEFELETSKC